MKPENKFDFQWEVGGIYNFTGTWKESLRGTPNYHKKRNFVTISWPVIVLEICSDAKKTEVFSNSIVKDLTMLKLLDSKNRILYTWYYKNSLSTYASKFSKIEPEQS